MPALWWPGQHTAPPSCPRPSPTAGSAPLRPAGVQIHFVVGLGEPALSTRPGRTQGPALCTEYIHSKAVHPPGSPSHLGHWHRDGAFLPPRRGVSTFCASQLALRLPRLPNSRLCVLQLCNSDTCTMPFSQRFWGFSVLLAVLCELRLKTFRLRIRG